MKANKQTLSRAVMLWLGLTLAALLAVGSATASDSNSFRFVVMGASQGDITSWQTGNVTNQAVLTFINEEINQLYPKPDFIIFLGDMATWGGADNLAAWQNLMRGIDNLAVAPATTWTSVSDNGIQLFTVIGAHDLYSQNTDPLNPTLEVASQQAYEDTFAYLPDNGPAGMDNNLAYAFTYENSFFAMLDPYYLTADTAEAAARDFSTDQLDWLNSQYTDGSTFRFAFASTPAFSVEGNPNLDNLWAVLDQKDFDFYFAGGENLYSRWTIDSSVNPAYTHNVTQIITGDAGAPPDDGLVTVTDPNIFTYTGYNFTVVDVSSQSAIETAYKVIDTGTTDPQGNPIYSSAVLDNFAVTQPYLVNRYDFTYYYADGDYYTGSVYAAPGRYYNNYIEWKEDENGSLGYYRITADWGTHYDNSNEGQVDIYNYYDHERDNSYGVTNYDQVGYFLGSESGILNETYPDSFLGRGPDGRIYEADATWDPLAPAPPLRSMQYNYEFVYTSGDYYRGVVYAASDYGYGLGYTQEALDGSGTWLGAYVITGASEVSPGPANGSVYISSYYDYESQTSYQPVAYSDLAGNAYLGSEEGYIVRRAVPEFNFGGAGHAEADVSSLFAFTFEYQDGDYYTGTVYAPADYYNLDFTDTALDVNGNLGHYRITGITDTGLDHSKDGEVYVANYYDADSFTVYPTVDPNYRAGTNYLKSEGGYILMNQVGEFHFGFNPDTGSMDEPTISSAYTYRFTYDTGDYYDGTVYAQADRYFVGYTQTETDIDGMVGSYCITGVTSGYQHLHDGEVTISNYHDAESDTDYGPVTAGSPMGTDYLGSEHDYIIRSGVSEFYFGYDPQDQRFHEADVSGQYSYEFTFASGDKYWGSVYADAAYGYVNGQTWDVTDDLGQTGTYRITGVNFGQDHSRDGMVFIDRYNDYQKDKDYDPLTHHNGWCPDPAGTNYLESESDYLLEDGNPRTLFGSRIHEAITPDDVLYAYDFTYYYLDPDLGAADYYAGTVFANPGTYEVGSKFFFPNESYDSGYYVITRVAIDDNFYQHWAGDVVVNSYYDLESNQTYGTASGNRIVGDGYLGSEYDYLLWYDGRTAAYFGGGYWEAQVPSGPDASENTYRYSFRYTFADSGDYYTGTVYAQPALDYHLGYTQDVTDGLGHLLGTYEITGVSTDTFDDRKADHVYVDQYFDAESGNFYTPIQASTYTGGEAAAVGRGYLGSESDYIIKNYHDEFFFGFGAQQANVVTAYSFQYTFADNDYYTGTVYAAADFGYHLGWTQTVTDALGQEVGVYTITGIAGSGYEASRAGQVFFSQYYDSQSGATFDAYYNIADWWMVKGTNYLGSEAGYILQTDTPDFHFSSLDEVDVLRAYSFKYTFANGDYYTGTVYAPAGFYHQWEAWQVLDEHGQLGTYLISAVDGFYDTSRDGRVYVNTYYDSQSDRTYGAVYSPSRFDGVSYLGSERDYIIQDGVAAYYFGGGYYEADVVLCHTFTYYFENGDYYRGRVYASPDLYYGDYNPYADPFHISAQWVNDEFGQPGAYLITSIDWNPADATYAGRVYVDSYYDSGQDQTYWPNNSVPAGWDYLGSEYGQLVDYDLDSRYGAWTTGVISEAYDNARPASAYDWMQFNFQFTYTSGDFYRGTVYGPWNLYYVGYQEDNPSGAYVITGATGVDNDWQAGQVYVQRYYDSESRSGYTPVHSTYPAGAGGLGSEHNFIITSGVSEFEFGYNPDNPLFYEADVSCCYDFEYRFAGGDYYVGQVYADAAYGYYLDYAASIVDEDGQTGVYRITAVHPGYDHYRDGQVYVSSYYDAGTARNYAVPEWNSGYCPTPVGLNYLGSESAYLIQDGNPNLLFGGGYWEADPVVAYTFRYDFASGDWYSGTAYALPDYGYFVGYTLDVVDEHGDPGQYVITAANLGDYAREPGDVLVDTYYDAQSSRYFGPVSSYYSRANGQNYLGSEYDYLNWYDGRAAAYFGGGFYEAEVPDTAAGPDENTLRYDFTYTYADGGDYYTGSVYALPSQGYFQGFTLPVTDQGTLLGSYEITGVSTDLFDDRRAGHVYVDQYFDAQSGNTYSPVHFGEGEGAALGLDYLGSESDYILKDFHPGFFFDNGHEADVVNAYYFQYTYANGDYYTGTVYAYPGNDYRLGYVETVTDGLGQELGWYTITGDAGSGYEAGLAGQVFLSQYYDAASGATFNAYWDMPDSWLPKGANYLGSEAVYILHADTPDFYFSPAQDAQVTVAYSYRYIFANGDYYTGTVYAAPAYGYRPYTNWQVTDENGEAGTYLITGTTGQYVDHSYQGWVFADNYCDGESGRSFSPVHNGVSYAGTNYLGSEYDYIQTEGVPQYYFGGGFYEADVIFRQSFTFYYANGDRYWGSVYSGAERYFAGYDASPYANPFHIYTQAALDENGLPGTYLVTYIDYWPSDIALDGQVYVEGYYDAGQNLTYNIYATLGTGYLGSEQGQLVGGDDASRFGAWSPGVIREAYDNARPAPSYDWAQFNFQYDYTGGDFYQGTVFAPADMYYVGYRESQSDDGVYVITGVTPVDNDWHNGQIYVNSYYDYESHSSCGVVHNTYTAGDDYLGSEHGFIIRSGVSEFELGYNPEDGLVHEADVSCTYNFEFHYADGDFYRGTVNAPSTYGYYLNYLQNTVDENGAPGVYCITSVSPGQDHSRDGWVYVSSYYDAGTNRYYSPPKWNSGYCPTPVGFDYLGSESDYLIQDGNPYLLFGAGYYEADPVLAYSFRYFYASGDWYSGNLYAGPADGYYVGYQQVVYDEHGDPGRYVILAANPGDYPREPGQVIVDTYYDAQSARYFSPASGGGVVGAAYLGSEADYLYWYDGRAAAYFGGGYWEAEVPDSNPGSDENALKYDFRYTFLSGDYYTGWVYAWPGDGYRLGYTQIVTDGQGQTLGAYVITAVSANRYDDRRAGHVYVNQYYDAQSNTSYTPILYSGGEAGAVGLSSLGSESDHIIKDYHDEFYFGGGRLEAGVVTGYNFQYTFADHGDYYTGTVYGSPDYGYWVGYSQAVLDGGLEVGRYVITGIAGSGYEANLAGQVLLTGYYDAQSDTSFPAYWEISDPWVPRGLNYLGSEAAYIRQNDTPDFFFSPTDAADVTRKYTFTYFFANGDSYSGSVWAAADGGYSKYDHWQVLDENGELGTYLITDVTGEFADHSYQGWVFVDTYYDAETGGSYSPVHSGTNYVGAADLGSEHDYIAQEGNPEFYFGGGYYEADVVVCYNFTYYFAGGDYYTGRVYAEPGRYYDGYRNPNWPYQVFNNHTEWLNDEHDQPGMYLITGISGWSWDWNNASYDSSMAGKVYVDSYYDAAQDRSWWLGYDNLAGAGYLGSETGQLDPLDTASQFGAWSPGLISEAYDNAAPPASPYAWARYDFQFNFTTGDVYIGYVYGPGDMYFRGYREDTAAGYYVVTNVTQEADGRRDGQVMVQAYYDFESHTWFNPVSWNSGNPAPVGDAYLGSEADYIVYGGEDPLYFGSGLMAANPSRRYDFAFTFAGGDYYTGQVYAAADYYAPGQIITATDEHGNLGAYVISGVTAGFRPSQDGQVTISKYYDAESRSSYWPDGYNSLSGLKGGDYLGSEAAYIIRNDAPDFFFGGDWFDTGSGQEWRIYEAEVFISYDFRFTYNHSDYYTGRVFAAPGYYTVGTALPGIDGVYVITAQETGYDSSELGNVYLYSYWDDETKNTYTPLSNWWNHQAAGLNYLGSESGYIIQDGVAEFFFSGGLQANVANMYYFTYFFDNGDFYSGTVYAPVSQGYYLSYTQQVTDAGDNRVGTYLITGLNSNQDFSRNGNVYFTGSSYFDVESGNYFSPVSAYSGLPAGDAFLGSESDYIIREAVPEFAFNNLNEADVWSKYGFTFTFGSGDSYTGEAYAPAGMYSNANPVTVVDEHGDTGTYHFDYIYAGYDSSQDGQVFLYSYHDAESNYTFWPGTGEFALVVNSPAGSGRLGSEAGYIISQDNPEHFFGRGADEVFYVADIPVVYTWYQYNGHQYALTNFRRWWTAAEAEAVAQGGHLVTINDAAEESWLAATFGSQQYWIGYYQPDGPAKVEPDGGWGWVSGEASTYTDWLAGEPNNASANEDYALMNWSGVSWVDIVNNPGPYNLGYYGIIEAPLPPSTQYSFAFYYDRGDCYYGSVYAAADTYTVDQQIVNEAGYYQILDANSVYGGDLIDQVYVASYYDGSSNHIYVPLAYAQGLPAGTGLLGSEGDYIVRSDIEDFRFGNGDGYFYEANAVNRYNFVFWYNSGGDYYYGDVYATYAGVEGLANVNSTPGLQGTYQFVDMAYGYAPAFDGAVQVTAYYDYDTRYAYPVSSTTGGLGGETAMFYGYVDSFAFGPSSSPLDLVNRYSFIYTYTSSGDYYYGQAYATVAEVVAVLATPPSGGSYQFVDVAYGFGAEGSSGVRVAGYYDQETRRAYAVQATEGSLGSENGEFYGYVDSFNFSPYANVELVSRYSFIYTYNSGGDYYFGQAYATVDQALAVLATPPSGGTYQFVDVACGLAPRVAPNNHVQVTAYYDADTRYAYTAHNTQGALGSETGSFYGYTDSFSFDPGSSVDLVNRYSFIYTYTYGGDYYYGRAYATAAQIEAASVPTSNGHYQFVDMAYGFAPPANPVQVTTYYEASAAHFYSVFAAVGPLGAEHASFMGDDGYLVAFGCDFAADINQPEN